MLELSSFECSGLLFWFGELSHRYLKRMHGFHIDAVTRKIAIGLWRVQQETYGYTAEEALHKLARREFNENKRQGVNGSTEHR